MDPLNTPMLLSTEPDCETWCRQEGLEFGLSTQMAYVILNPPKTPYIYELLPELPIFHKRPDVWEELVRWRYPHLDLDLNLLQLAIIYGVYSAVVRLWQPPFLEEESYTDESSKLVNHPVHLLLTIQRDFLYPISRQCDIRDEIFCKEGTVDLTSARLRISHSRTRHVQASLDSSPAQAAYAGVSVSQSRAAQENPLRELKEKYAGGISFDEVGTRTDFALLRQLDYNTINMVLFYLEDKLWSGGARASTVELLWALSEALSSQGIRFGFYCSTLLPLGRDLGGERREEVLILACQLYWAVSENKTELLSLDDHIAGAMDTAVKNRIDILRAVRYLPNETILCIIRHLQFSAELAEVFQRAGDSELSRAAADNLRRMLQQRTLQDHCVLSILKAVRGDARKVWSMTDYPEVLRQKFHVPLKELHRSLQSASQVD